MTSPTQTSIAAKILDKIAADIFADVQLADDYATAKEQVKQLVLDALRNA